MSKWFAHTVFWIFLSAATFLQAQDQEKAYSLIKTGALEIYENPDKAIKTGQQIIALSGKNVNLRIKGLLLISDGFSAKRDYEKSLRFVIEARNLAVKTDNPVLQIKILTKIAKQYQQLKIYDKALQFLDASGKLGAAYPRNDSIRFLMGNNYIIRGFIYKEQLDCDIAIGYFKQGIEAYKGLQEPLVKANLSVATYNIGNCCLMISDYGAAKKSFGESIAYAEQIDANSLKAFAQKGLAEAYTIEGNYKGAIKVLLEAKSISNTIGDLVLNLGIYKGLSENYLAVNDWKQYQKFNALYLETQSKTTSSERKSVGDSLDESAESLKDATKQSVFWYSCGIGAMIALSFAVLAFIISDGKKSAKRLLHLRAQLKRLSD